jgi:hypothetical protein
VPSKGGAESQDNARFSKAALSRRLSASPPRNCGCCSSGLHSTSRRQKAESRKPSPTAQTWHSAKTHLRNEHSTINCETDEFDYDVRLPLDDLSDEDKSCEADESDYDLCMPIDDLSDRDSRMADRAAHVDSPRSATC